MPMPRETWTDERLDDLRENMNERFNRVDREFVRMDAQMKEGFARVDREMKEGFARVDREMKAGFARVDKEFGELRAEMKEMRGDLKGLRSDLGGMQRVMVQGVIAICSVMTTGFVALVGITAF